MREIDYIDVLEIVNDELSYFFSIKENRRLKPDKAYKKLYSSIKNRISLIKNRE